MQVRPGESITDTIKLSGGKNIMPTKKESLLRSKDVAHILDCSPDDVIELARRGKLRASKQGRFWRFKHNDVLVYKKKFESMAS